MDRRFEENNVEDFAGAREGHYFDRKSARKDVDEIAKHVMAFANAAGGKLVVGIEDDGTVTGFKRDKAHSIEGFEQSYLTELSPAPLGLDSPSAGGERKGRGRPGARHGRGVRGEPRRPPPQGRKGRPCERGTRASGSTMSKIRALEYDKGEHYFESEVLLDYGIEDVDREALAMYKRALGTDVGDEKLLRSGRRAQRRASHQRGHDAVRREPERRPAADEDQGAPGGRHRARNRVGPADRQGPARSTAPS